MVLINIIVAETYISVAIKVVQQRKGNNTEQIRVWNKPNDAITAP